MTPTTGGAGTKGATPGAIIKGLKPGQFATLCKVQNGGALQARRMPDGSTRLYWRYTAHGKTDRVVIGRYDPQASPKSLTPSALGYSIRAAERECEARAQVQAEQRDTGGYRAVKNAERAAYEAKLKAEADRSRHTLRGLLVEYCDYLQSLGRRSHIEARSLFRLHVFEAAPELASLPAVSVTGDALLDLMRRLNEKKKGRTANKLRSYLHAAYRVAMMSKSKASIPVSFKNYGVTSNPAAETTRDASHDRADKNPLSEEELRAYWLAIKDQPGIQGAALRLHLLTGGQRIEQLTKLRRDRVTADSFTIYDLKGKPGYPPRAHVLPLIPAALAALQSMPAGEGSFAISTDGGKTPLNAVTLARWAQDVPHGIAAFQLKRVRSGVETLLSRHGVSRDHRGELQSHGLSGVQKRHYDGNDFLPEKKAALLKLFRALEAKPGARVIPLRAA